MANLVVKRTQYKSKGKEYYNYKVKGLVLGRECVLEMIPPDKEVMNCLI